MRIALAGVGRMGAAISGRLRAAGHRVTLYDPALPAGGEVAPTLAAAANRSVLTFLCLPDAAAVEASLPGLMEAAPPIVVDLTSSLPSTTRRVGAALAPLGVDLLDCPLSGGVAGARAGTLTAMVGGDPDLLERVRPVLSTFATNVRWAGPLGSGHATKALNNALSAVALTATAEMLVMAAAHGASEAAVIDAFNRGPARSQNSEVKFPRDILPRTYAAGFTAGLMEKDLATALEMAAARAVETPLLAGTLSAWREATAAMGPGADFTRVHAVIAGRSGGRAPGAGEPAALAVGVLERALAAVNLMAAREALRIADAEGLDRHRVLAIVNTSTGRSEATRAGASGTVDAEALGEAARLAGAARAWAPVTTLGADLTRGRRGGPSRIPSGLDAGLDAGLDGGLVGSGNTD
ncbi:MAG TPA: NAD-binding protein [Candidatus Dormibacteraeota bacterium]|nr:NAD-binding protein [Candidatus Dormibacteraeota bacterium]